MGKLQGVRLLNRYVSKEKRGWFENCMHKREKDREVNPTFR